MDKKKHSLALFLLVIALFAIASFAHADDDDDENDDDEEDESVSRTVEMITQTIVIEPARTVTTTIMKNFNLSDADRDGIPNEQDMYPDIPQQFIVNDSNFDGIDDRYEIQNP